MIEAQKSLVSFLKPQISPEHRNIKIGQTYVKSKLRSDLNNINMKIASLISLQLPWRSNHAELFPPRFLPSPILLAHVGEGLEISTSANFGSLFWNLHVASAKGVQDIFYDEFCSSLKNKDKHGKNLLGKRKCSKGTCSLVWFYKSLNRGIFQWRGGGKYGVVDSRPCIWGKHLSAVE